MNACHRAECQYCAAAIRSRGNESGVADPTAGPACAVCDSGNVAMGGLHIIGNGVLTCGRVNGVADPTRGDAAGEQAQPSQHRDAAGKPADSSGERCSLCGSMRMLEDDGALGACGYLECRDPMHDYRKEHGEPAPAPVAADYTNRPGAKLVADARALIAKYEPLADIAELRAEVARLRGKVERKDAALKAMQGAMRRWGNAEDGLPDYAFSAYDLATAALAPATPESAAPSPTAAAQDELVRAARAALALLSKRLGSNLHPKLIDETIERLRLAIDAVAQPESTRSEK